MKPYTIAIAGSTSHTAQCAEALLQSPLFSISWILTPAPKQIGRNHTLTKNPLHDWAEAHQIPVVLLNKKIDFEIKNTIEQKVRDLGELDFLLVVDFGYIIPNWLLEVPRIAPLNIHPSLLPKWRGSSPGQFVLLYGDRNSGITLMQMDAGLDSGPVIHQERFAVETTWTQNEYYQYSFGLMTPVLAEKIVQFAQNGQKTAQPSILPTPIARRLTREDGFVSWRTLTTGRVLENELLKEVTTSTNQDTLEVIEHACRAFSPWPGLWTMIPTAKGEKRMQILQCHVDSRKGFILDEVKIEGQAQASWSQVKNQIQEK